MQNYVMLQPLLLAAVHLPYLIKNSGRVSGSTVVTQKIEPKAALPNETLNC